MWCVYNFVFFYNVCGEFVGLVGGFFWSVGLLYGGCKDEKLGWVIEF